MSWDRRAPAPIAAAALALLAMSGPAGADPDVGKVPARGLVRPLHQASIATDLGLPVASIGFREAEAFRKGDVLVTFDCERLAAEQRALEAISREMKLTLDSNTYLDKKGAVGKLDVEVSRARVDKAAADSDAAAARLKQCTVVAPFDGRVTELTINEHETPSPGRSFISLVDETEFEIDLIVPSLWLKGLTPGMKFKFVLDETGRSYEAEILRIGAAIDPVSQTVKVIAGFASKDGAVVSGMSGSAEFPNLVLSQ